jgi:UTP--glucose-1-phosphate uridylyltransferase
MAIKNAVITAAGLGTRLLPFSKEIPKEMLPLLVKSRNGVYAKPTIQIIYEQLYDAGFREFCIIVGRGKRAIEDHFTPDRSFVRYLRSKGKKYYATDLEDFYSKIESSSIVWINQAEPRGFGHAVIQARRHVHDDDFLLHAGDTYVYSTNNYVRSVLDAFKNSKETAAVLLLIRVKDPRPYGVAEVDAYGDLLTVRRVVEKPKKPRSNLAIMPVYCFSTQIFNALQHTNKDKLGELQLTDAIQGLIESGNKVMAIRMQNGESLDIGSPEVYIESLKNLLHIH